MGDEDSVVWPSTLPPCPVAAAIACAVQIAMAQKIDEMWKQPAGEER
jgi:predicted lipoprotein